MTQSDIARAEPIYEELPGWWEDISGAREFDDLPAKARDYVLRLEELAGAHVSCIGVGPGRDQTIVRRDILAAARLSDRTISSTPTTTSTAGSRISKPAEPGPGFGRFLTAMRRAQDLAVSAHPDSDTWDAGRRPCRGTRQAARPVRGRRKVCGPANRVSVAAGIGAAC